MTISLLFAGEIIIKNKFAILAKEADRLDGDSLILFDVDATLIVPNDALLKPKGKDLCASGLIRTIHEKFSQIVDPRKFLKKSSISLVDCLMSCFAVFNLKWPSLLQYEEEKKIAWS